MHNLLASSSKVLRTRGTSSCVYIYIYIHLKAEGHYFAGQAVAPKKGLHGVGQFHFFGEHVPQELVEQVTRVKQCYEHSGELILGTQDMDMCNTHRLGKYHLILL